jgi:hypothetical protein
VEKGMIEGDPPTISYMVDNALDTIYDGIAMSFNLDVDRFVPSLQLDTYRYRIIPRTQMDDGEREFNPEFVSYRRERGYSWGSLPAGSIKPGYSGNEELEGSEQGNRGWANEDTTLGLGGGVPDSAKLTWPHIAGMWDEYQIMPTPHQEQDC